MMLTDAYLGLGGNLQDPLIILKKAIGCIRALTGVFDVQVSRFYRTSPVGGIVQPDFVNAACKLKTSLPALELLQKLQEIEKSLGKRADPLKNAPRTIDIDILLFGTETHNQPQLMIPHPRWTERMFVLKPLLDITTELVTPSQSINLIEFIKNFKNPHNEKVFLLE